MTIIYPSSSGYFQEDNAIMHHVKKQMSSQFYEHGNLFSFLLWNWKQYRFHKSLSNSMEVSKDFYINIHFLECQILLVTILKWAIYQRHVNHQTWKQRYTSGLSIVTISVCHSELVAGNQFHFCFWLVSWFPLVCTCQAEERAQFEILKSQMYAERTAKRDRKPKRARAVPADEPQNTG